MPSKVPVMSYFNLLQCSRCHKLFEIHLPQTYCQHCNAPILARYDLDYARHRLDRDEFRQRHSGMWRWHELLPVLHPTNRISLGEGDTPLLSLDHLGPQLGLANLFVKDESLNPTGTFKARGLSVAVSKAKEMGIKKVIIPTAGNAGGAMAAYAARGGLQSCIFMPQDTPYANIEESRISGAAVILVEGLISDAASLASVKAKNEGWFDLSTFKEPYRLEGKKTMGYEIAEAFNWSLPDVIIYPTGGGTGLVGMWKAFTELETVGWLNNNLKPRMVVVQAEGCAPVVRAFQMGKTSCDFWEKASTIASGLKVPKSFADQLILQILYESEGIAVSVRDDEILAAQRQLASQEGIFPAPEGAATLAGLKKIIRSKWINPSDRIVLFNTGSGLKYLYHG